MGGFGFEGYGSDDYNDDFKGLDSPDSWNMGGFGSLEFTGDKGS